MNSPQQEPIKEAGSLFNLTQDGLYLSTLPLSLLILASLVIMFFSIGKKHSRNSQTRSQRSVQPLFRKTEKYRNDLTLKEEYEYTDFSSKSVINIESYRRVAKYREIIHDMETQIKSVDKEEAIKIRQLLIKLKKVVKVELKRINAPELDPTPEEIEEFHRATGGN